MVTYRRIFAEALKIVWHNPITWFLGLFVSLLSVGGEVELLFRTVSLGTDPGLFGSFLFGLQEGGLFTLQGIKGSEVALTTQLGSSVIVIGLLVALTALLAGLLWLTIVSQGALINRVVMAAKRKPSSGSENFAVGRRHFWPVLSLNIVSALVSWLLIAPLFYLANLGLSFAPILFFVSYIVATIIVIVVAFIVRLSILAIVLKDQTPREAFKQAKSLLKTHWVFLIEVAMLLYIIFWVSIQLVFALGGIIAAGFIAASLGVGLFAVVGVSIAFIITVVGIAILSAFQWATWTLVFEILNSKKIVIESKLVSLWNRRRGR